MIGAFGLCACNKATSGGLVRVAIVPATVLTADQALDWTSKGVPIVVYQDLMTSHLVAPVVVANDSSAYAANVGRILRTTVESYHNRLILKGTLTDLKTQKSIQEFTVEGQSSDSLIDSADKLASKIAFDAGMFSTRSDKALISYTEAFGVSGQKQLQSLNEAVGIDPAFGLAQNSLLELVATQSTEQALQVAKRAAPYRAKFTPLDGVRFDLQVARLNRQPLADLAKQVKELLALAPGDLPALLMLAQLSAADHKLPEAISHLNDAIGVDPGNVQARQMLAGAYLNSHQDEAARKTVSDLLALRPDDANVIRMQAEVEFATVHLAEAERAYKGLNDAAGVMGAAVCRLLEGDPAGAKAQFERAAALRANDPLLPFGRATWLALSGERAKAIQLLTSAKMPNSDFQSVALSQASVYQTLNKNPGAAQTLAAASLNAAQTDVPKSFALVSSLVAHGSERLGEFQMRLGSANLDPGGKTLAAGYAYFFAGRYQEALAQWELVLKKVPGDLRGQIMRAACLNRQGRTVEAIKDSPRLLMPNLNGGEEMAVPAFTELVRVRAAAERQAGNTAAAETLNKAIALYHW